MSRKREGRVCSSPVSGVGVPCSSHLLRCALMVRVKRAFRCQDARRYEATGWAKRWAGGVWGSPPKRSVGGLSFREFGAWRGVWLGEGQGADLPFHFPSCRISVCRKSEAVRGA